VHIKLEIQDIHNGSAKKLTESNLFSSLRIVWKSKHRNKSLQAWMGRASVCLKSHDDQIWQITDNIGTCYVRFGDLP